MCNDYHDAKGIKIWDVSLSLRRIFYISLWWKAHFWFLLVNAMKQTVDLDSNVEWILEPSLRIQYLVVISKELVGTITTTIGIQNLNSNNKSMMNSGHIK